MNSSSTGPKQNLFESERVYRRALALRKARKIDDGLTSLSQAADLNHLSALFELGYAHDNFGWGIFNAHSTNAIKWYKKAVDLGHLLSIPFYLRCQNLHPPESRVYECDTKMAKSDEYSISLKRKVLEGNDDLALAFLLYYCNEAAKMSDRLKDLSSAELWWFITDIFEKYAIEGVLIAQHYYSRRCESNEEWLLWNMKAAGEGFCESQSTIACDLGKTMTIESLSSKSITLFNVIYGEMAMEQGDIHSIHKLQKIYNDDTSKGWDPYIYG